MLAALIGQWGHSASVAYDGEEGFRVALKDTPDCLILEVRMPKINGYALAQMLRRQAKLAGAKDGGDVGQFRRGAHTPM